MNLEPSLETDSGASELGPVGPLTHCWLCYTVLSEHGFLSGGQIVSERDRKMSGEKDEDG